jgi:hypothetical protein
VSPLAQDLAGSPGDRPCPFVAVSARS